MSDDMQLTHARSWNFDKLVREGLSLIPAYALDWTNHNPSDPGITLLELFAYISEILIYRALRVTPDAKFNFLRLLGAPGNVVLEELAGQPAHEIEAKIRARVEEMMRESIVTPSDFEALATTTVQRLHPDPFRVKCLPGVDVRRMMQAGDLTAVEAPGDISVLVALKDAASHGGLFRALQDELQQHCPLTSRAHVAEAVELHVRVGCRIAPEPGMNLRQVIEAVDAALRRRFDPLTPDASSDASPFGRTLHLASVAGAIDRTDGVDFVEDVVVLRIAVSHSVREEEALVGIRIGSIAHVGVDTRLGGRASIPLRRLQTDLSGEAEAIILQPWEVMRVRLERDTVRPVGDDVEFGNPRGGRDG
jgi:hypothetical protein